MLKPSKKLSWRWLMLLPALSISLAFFIIPIVALIALSFNTNNGDINWFDNYLKILTVSRYWQSMLVTIFLAVCVTLTSLILSTVSGLFLVRYRFYGRSLLISMLTFPLAFPGVVIGFFVIMLGGRQGISTDLSLWLFDERWVFAYSLFGLFIGYIYFSIPRVIINVMAAAEKIDPSLVEAARSLHAPVWRVFLDVSLPALKPGLIASGSICFATAMGAFGTAFTLATDISVIPMMIYTEFTLNANFAMAAALSMILGLVTWVCLIIASRYQNDTVVIGA